MENYLSVGDSGLQKNTSCSSFQQLWFATQKGKTMMKTSVT
jgi:hypothetical protein